MVTGRCAIRPKQVTKMPLRFRRFTFLLVLTSLLLLPFFTEFGFTQQAARNKEVWDVKLASNTQAKSNITIQNQCKQSHSFTVVPQSVPYLRLPADPTVTVSGHSTQNFPVTFNTDGMQTGEYRGTVTVKCDTCREERGCAQSNEILPLRLTIPPIGALQGPTPTRTAQVEEGQSCTDEKCKVKEVILNTGYDQAAGAPYTPVQPDGYWELVDSPNPGLTIPTSAWVINSIWGSPLPNSKWISAYNNANWNVDNPAPEKPYSFQRCFCTCEGIKTLDIDLLMLVDNVADVYFDGVLIGQQTDETTGSFTKPLHIHPPPIEIKPGKHCLRIDVRNLSGVAMGLDITGTIKSASPVGAPLFLSPACCSPAGKIMGRKIDDANCNGKDDNEPGLPGWIITATNTITGATVTATTDANGFYYFNNLSPGTYTISESPQAGWSQSIPGGGGTYTVKLETGQVIQRDFGNCRKAQESCAQVTTREVACKADGAGGYVYSFSITNNSGRDVHQILLTPPAGSTFTLSQQVFNLSTPLQNGQSTTLTVNIGNVKPGEKVCFLATLMSRDGPCCTVEVCPVLPSCCAQIKDVRLVPVANSPGSFDYTFTVVNMTPNVIENIYLTPPSGVTVTPVYLPVSIPGNGGSVTQTVRITGATPGSKVCFRISLHTRGMKECCSLEHCISVPGDAMPRPGRPQ